MYTNNLDDLLSNYGLQVESEQIQLSEEEQRLIDAEFEEQED